MGYIKKHCHFSVVTLTNSRGLLNFFCHCHIAVLRTFSQLNNVIFPAQSDRAFLRRGAPPLPRREETRLRLRGVPADARQVREHVRRARRAKEHEELCQERLLHLSPVS